MKFIFSVCVLFYLNCNVAFTSDVPCTLRTSVNISDGVALKNGSIIKDDILYDLENQINGPNSTKFGCLCNIKNCIRKCCPIGEYLLYKNCTPTDVSFNIPDLVGPPLDNFNVLTGNTCVPPKRRRLVNPEVEENLERVIVRSDGRLYLSNTKETLSPEDYCIDHIDDQEDIKALICVDKKKIINFTNVIGMIISMPFLLATFLVYAFLPDRNLHGTSLMYYVLTLFGAYFLLVFIQLYPYDLNDTICIAVAIFCYFFFMVSFFMMNVMSIDIWWAFSGLRGFSGSRKEKERKRFLLYNGYAWGVPLLLVAIVLPLTLQEDIPNDAWYNPGIAQGQCWFLEGLPKFVYFYGLITILLIANLVLFVITAYKIKRVQMETAVLKRDDNRRHNYENDKQRFNLFLKLMLAMGINWSMEIISWVVNLRIVRVPDEVWYLTDFFNAVYGVFIFFIFVFKRNIWKLLKKRYYLLLGKPNLARTITLVDYSPNAAGTPNNNKNGSVYKQKTDETILSDSVAV